MGKLSEIQNILSKLPGDKKVDCSIRSDSDTEEVRYLLLSDWLFVLVLYKSKGELGIKMNGGTI